MDGRTLLSIDFSRSSTGLCCGRWGDKPHLTSLSFGREGDIHSVASEMIQWLPGALSLYKPEIVCLEAALPAYRSENDLSARYALGADFLIKGACSIKGIRMDEVNNSSWK